MSIERDLTALRRITAKLKSKKAFDKNIIKMLDNLEEKVQIPFKCLWCGERMLKDKIQFHKCPGGKQKYLVASDRRIVISAYHPVEGHRFYKYTFFKKDFWFENKDFLKKFVNLIKSGKCIMKALDECGSQLAKSRFPKYKKRGKKI